jgi:putative addiction module component (TIGR02574 family)
MIDVESVLAAALRLPAKERAAVAAELIQSLDETEQTTESAEEIEAAWGDEIRQRLADVDAGVVTPVSWPEARRRIFAAANSRRETP